jgi:UDP-N-acetylglucosamine acyltransferase
MDGLTAGMAAARPELEMSSTASEVHPSAVVHRRARLGEGVRIGPFCTVGPDVELGDRVQLMSHVVVDGCTRLGADVTVFPFASVGLAPQDLKYAGEPTRCEIGAGTQIREHCSIHRGTPNGRGVTTVGQRCMLMAVVHVAHDCKLGDHVVVANNVVMGGHVTIDDHAVIGGSAALHQFVHIGRGAMVGGMVGVPGDVVPFGMVTAVRAGWVEGLNVIGLQRRGYGRAQMRALRAAFRSLFSEEGVFAERVARTRAEHGDDALVAEILDFVAAQGKRGLTPARIARAVADDAGGGDAAQ